MLYYTKKKKKTKTILNLLLPSNSKPHVHLRREIHLHSQSEFLLALFILKFSIPSKLKQSLVTELSGNKDICAFWIVFGSRDLIHLLVIHYYCEILPRAFKICVSIHLHDILCRITCLHLASVLPISIFSD